MEKSRPILLVGVPRSGSTWIAKVLSKAKNNTLFLEPDNEKENPLAYVFKKNLHRYPYINENDDQTDYYKLWKANFSEKRIPDKMLQLLNKHFMPEQNILEFQVREKCNSHYNSDFFRIENDIRIAGAKKLRLDKMLNYLPRLFFLKRTTGRIIVKSVHANLSLPWIDKNFNPHIVVIFRNPLNVIASYLKLKMPDSIRNIFGQEQLIHDHLSETIDQISTASTLVQKMAVQIGSIYYVLEQQIKQHPNWIITMHETLCENPIGEFKKLFEQVNLKWSQSAEDYLVQTNKKGEGFTRNRIAKDEIDKWKRNLTTEQIDDIQKYIKIFNLDNY